VEGDASSASYFLAGAAITGGTVTVEGCGTSSLQVKPLNCFDCNSLKSGGMNLKHGNSIYGGFGGKNPFKSLKEAVLFLGCPLSHL
jgi:5-enolpyruvylshikimate-3-phosphate synthase